MKIKKILTENLKELLTEDVDEPEVTLDEINPNQASTSAIADAIQGSVEEITGDDTVADNVAAATAQEVKDVAQETGAGQVALDPTALPANIDEDEFVGCENILTKTLDKALRSARTAQKLKVRPDANVLVIGLPGSGKTSIVYDWAKTNGINIFYVSCKDPQLESALYGLTARDMKDPTSNKVTHLSTDFLDGLDRPNSVLFLDEINRGKDSNRSALLDLINKHTIVDPNFPTGNRKFGNLLFTISVMNPAGSFGGDTSAKPLFTAEASRYKYILSGMNSDPATSMDFITKYSKKKIKELDENDPDFWEIAIAWYKNFVLESYILSHRDFAFDTEDDDEELNAGGGKFKQLNSRALLTGLQFITDPNEALDWIRDTSGFLEKDKDMLVGILRDYISSNAEPSEAECREAISQIRNGKVPAAPAETSEVPPAAPSNAGEQTTGNEEELEDDEDLFGDIATASANQTGAPTPASVSQDINDMLNGW